MTHRLFSEFILIYSVTNEDSKNFHQVSANSKNFPLTPLHRPTTSTASYPTSLHLTAHEIHQPLAHPRPHTEEYGEDWHATVKSPKPDS